MAATIRNGNCRGCDAQSHEPLVVILMFSLDHTDMITPDMRTVITEVTAQSCCTQRPMVFAVLFNPAVGYKCLPGSPSLRFRLRLELSLSHILSGRKIHEPQIRFQEALEPGKLFGQVSVLCHTLFHLLGWWLLPSHRTVSKAKLVSEELVLSLCSSGSHFPSEPQLLLEEGRLTLLQAPLTSSVLSFYSGWQAEFLGPQTVSCLLLKESMTQVSGSKLENASLFSRLLWFYR